MTRNSTKPGTTWLILLSKHQEIYQVMQNAMGRARDKCGRKYKCLQNVVGKSNEREHLTVVSFYRNVTLKLILNKIGLEDMNTMADFLTRQ
jgi:hypothetical protein